MASPTIKNKKNTSKKITPKKKMEKPSEEAKNVNIRPLNLYKRIALSFIFLTLLLLVAVFYLSFVKVDIVLYPKTEIISDNLAFDLYDTKTYSENGDVKNKILGIVDQVVIEAEKEYISTGEEVVGKEVTGKVTIINDRPQNQKLVATTRLLSPNDKLYRLKNTVDIPAGGSLEVEVYADDPSPENAIQPTRFTIPGLWAGLQDKVYGVSKESFVYQTKGNKYIRETDIDSAIMDLKNRLVEKAKLKFGNYDNYNEVMYSLDDDSIEVEIDGEEGEEKDVFLARATASVNVVAFSNEQIEKLAQEKILTFIPSNKELSNFREDGIVYKIDKYYLSDKYVTITASFAGDIILKNNAELINKEKIVGLNKKQLEVYLNGFSELKGYDIKFSPYFIDKVPKLVDRISIEIKQ